MRYAFISDIHANWEALTAVLADIEKEHVDEMICLGDMVGYGPNPLECVREIRKRNIPCLLGNHEWGLLEGGDLLYWSANHARVSILYARQGMTATERSYLSSLPTLLTRDAFMAVHGSLAGDHIQTSIYTLDYNLVRENFTQLDKSLLFYGHVHTSGVWYEEKNACFDPIIEGISTLTTRALISVGSVGLPRDKDPRASYVLYDAENNTATFKRVAYDIEATIQKVRSMLESMLHELRCKPANIDFFYDRYRHGH